MVDKKKTVKKKRIVLALHPHRILSLPSYNRTKPKKQNYFPKIYLHKIVAAAVMNASIQLARSISTSRKRRRVRKVQTTIAEQTSSQNVTTHTRQKLFQKRFLEQEHKANPTSTSQLQRKRKRKKKKKVTVGRPATCERNTRPSCCTGLCRSFNTANGNAFPKESTAQTHDVQLRYNRRLRTHR